MLASGSVGTLGTFRGFLDYVGLKKSTRRASSLGIIVSLLFALPVLALILTNPAFVDVMTEPQSVTGRIRQMGLSMDCAWYGQPDLLHSRRILGLGDIEGWETGVRLETRLEVQGWNRGKVDRLPRFRPRFLFSERPGQSDQKVGLSKTPTGFPARPLSR